MDKLAKKTTAAFAVYKKFSAMGVSGRAFVVAFPKKREAERWVDENSNSANFDQFMVEEATLTMNEWTPEF